MPELYLQLLREEVARFALPELARGVKFTVARLGPNAVAIGSVAWLRQRQKDNTTALS
jgi:glucokinase